MAEVPVAVDTIISLLQECRAKKNLSLAKQVHAYICEHQLESHTALGNYLVPVLVECGSLLCAQQVLHKLTHRSVHSWTALISDCTDCSDPQHAFVLYQDMQMDHVRPNLFTFLALVKACTRLEDVVQGRRVHADIIVQGCDAELSLSNSLVDMYGKCGSMSEGQDVFNRIATRDEVSWTSLISGYADHGLGKDALRCFHRMQLDGIPPNSSIFVCSLKACSGMKDKETGQILHSEIIIKGLERCDHVGNILVDLYSKCGMLAEARQVFDKMPVQDLVSWTALISGYAEGALIEEVLCCFEQMQQKGISPNASTFVCSLKTCHERQTLERGHLLFVEIVKRGFYGNLIVGSALVDMYIRCGLPADAQKIFDQLPVRNAVSWTALIAGYAENQFAEEALNCFNKMQVDGVSPDAFVFACSLKSCGIIGTLETGQVIHNEAVKRGLERKLSFSNTLVDFYGKCGLLADGRQVFDNMQVRDVVTWTSMIKSYGGNHEGKMAVECFEDMHGQGMKPNAITFICLLDACCHGSLVCEGQRYFQVMQEVHKIEPTLEHYACMVNLLAHAGKLYEADKYVEAMRSSQCKEEVLTALLSACKIHGEVDLGLKCFQQLIQINQDDASPYLTMADIYASAGRLNDVTEIEEMRKCAGIVRKPASVSIEMNNTLYKFVVGDDEKSDILAMFLFLILQMRDREYVPNVDLNLAHLSVEGNEVTSSEVQSMYYITEWEHSMTG